MTHILDHQPGIAAQDDERNALDQLLAVLQAGRSPEMRGLKGESIALPPVVTQLLHQIIEHLAHGDYVQVVSIPDELTLQQAAEILHVSRQFVMQLIEAGTLPAAISGSQRRLHLQDVLTYKQEQSERARKAIDEIAALSQESGNYH